MDGEAEPRGQEGWLGGGWSPGGRRAGCSVLLYIHVRKDGVGREWRVRFSPSEHTFKGFALKQPPPSPLSSLKPRRTLVRETSDPSVWTQLKHSVGWVPGDGTTAQAPQA